ncbi:MAG: DUF86 domain-containing protein [Deltaproteobacteria bacterium]|nr:DUF86 domain-containing protein [Deltaproteobacteria bacterium]
MTVRPAVILARLAHLGHALAQLQRLRDMPLSERADAINRFALERALQISAEAIFDVGHHVLAGRGLPVPRTYREVIPALTRAGVWSVELATRLEGLAGLRNILVHDYVEIDGAQLWDLLDHRLGDLVSAQTALASIEELGEHGA